ncbi:MAG TPA: FixH family protein [Rhizomicrobium sp.]|jgi:nitrogen fixation protein FixH|nr:FixH family protein [Rhizomicrobium sp.]
MSKPLTGRGVLLLLIGFFGVILATNVVFIALAVGSFRGEDEQKPYQQGVAYNQTIARRGEQARLGWSADISATRLASGLVRIELVVKDRDGGSRQGLQLAGLLRHPADENRDRRITLHPVSPGRYRADVGGVTSGTWDVQVKNGGQEPFQAGRRLWVR